MAIKLSEMMMEIVQKKERKKKISAVLTRVCVVLKEVATKWPE